MSFGKSSNPVISVGMPVRNAWPFLESAVQSIKKQSFKEWELIIADDGSCDNAIGKLPKKILQDPRIRILRFHRQGGIALRLNQILRQARGQFFARMDADDISHPKRFEAQLAFLKNNPKIDVVGCSCLLIDEKNRPIGRYDYPRLHSEICERPWWLILLAHPTWMGRTAWFRQNPYANPAPYRCEDQELLLRTFRSSRFHNIARQYLGYRQPGSGRIYPILKTRISLLKVQQKNFFMAREQKNLIYSALVTIPKILKDLLALGGVSQAPSANINPVLRGWKVSSPIPEWLR